MYKGKLYYTISFDIILFYEYYRYYTECMSFPVTA